MRGASFADHKAQIHLGIMYFEMKWGEKIAELRDPLTRREVESFDHGVG